MKDGTGKGAIKVRRERRRIYEPGDTGATEGPRLEGARKIVKNYSMWSAGAGLVPIPLVDMAAVAALELKMLKSLSAHYGIEFQTQRAKSVVSSLIGGVHGGLITGSILKLVPFAGSSLLALTPFASGAITYAIGTVFIQHFESGGTLLDFDIARGRDRVREKLR